MKLTRTLLIFFTLTMPNLQAGQTHAKDHVLDAFCIAAMIGAVAKTSYLLYKNSAAHALKAHFYPKLQLLRLHTTGHTAWDIARKKSLSDLKLFLDHDKSLLNAQNDSGQTLLTDAIERKDKALAQFLLECGASAHTRDGKRRTPLHIAAETGQKKLCQMLLRAQAEVDACADNGQTALHYAAREGIDYIVRLLLKANANVNKEGRWGKRPLHLATQNNHYSTTQLLLRNGADVNASFGGLERTAWDLAHSRGHRDVARLLVSHGAEPKYLRTLHAGLKNDSVRTLREKQKDDFITTEPLDTDPTKLILLCKQGPIVNLTTYLQAYLTNEKGNNFINEPVSQEMLEALALHLGERLCSSKTLLEHWNNHAIQQMLQNLGVTVIMLPFLRNPFVCIRQVSPHIWKLYIRSLPLQSLQVLNLLLSRIGENCPDNLQESLLNMREFASRAIEEKVKALVERV